MNSTVKLAQNVTLNVNEIRILTPDLMRYLSFVIGGIGLTGNAFVVLVILSAASMRGQITNAYITNQSLVDGLVSLVLLLTTIFEDDGRRYESTLDDVFCKLWLTKLWLWGLFVSSTYNLLALTLERYLAVVHPIWHKMKLTRRKVGASIVFVWVFGPAYNMAYMVPASGITDIGQCTVYSLWPNSLSQHAVGVLTIVIQYLGPLCLLVFFYTRMIIVLRRRVRPEAHTNITENQAHEKKPDSMARARKNILKTLAIVAFCFVFCWTWNQTYFLLFNLGLKSVDFTSIFYNFTVVMVFMNCCINPFVYIAKYEQFQKSSKKLFCRKKSNADVSQFNISSIE